MKLNAQELRTADEADVQAQAAALPRQPIYLILENIYDTYNIGGLFRLADALAVSKIYICGQSEIPPNPKIKKASIGTYKIVPWAYFSSVAEAIADIKASCNLKLETQNGEAKKIHATCYKLQVIAIEQAQTSLPYTQITYSSPVALILGNETYGVLPETLALADNIAEIPMWGINKSLNVIVSAAIVSYHVIQAFSLAIETK